MVSSISALELIRPVEPQLQGFFRTFRAAEYTEIASFIAVWDRKCMKPICAHSPSKSRF